MREHMKDLSFYIIHTVTIYMNIIYSIISKTICVHSSRLVHKKALTHLPLPHVHPCFYKLSALFCLNARYNVFFTPA